MFYRSKKIFFKTNLRKIMYIMFDSRIIKIRLISYCECLFLLFFFLCCLYLTTYIYIYICACRFRRAPHRWLSTFFMPINQRVSNSTLQQQLTHQQKVSNRTPIVLISFFIAPSLRHVYIGKISLLLCLCLSPSVFLSVVPLGSLFFALFG